MFVRQIEETVFTSKTADKLFAGRGLEVGSYRGDLSLRATLRALLLNRPTGKIVVDVDEPSLDPEEIETAEKLRENIWKVIPGYKTLGNSNDVLHLES